MAGVLTRNKSKCLIFGDAKELSNNVLPTYEDVMQYYLYVKHQLKPDITSKEPSVSSIAEIVATNIENIWHKASIPIVSHTRVLQLIKTYHDKYRNILKSAKGRGYCETYKKKVEKLQTEARSSLFDIAACKCIDFSTCTCEKSRKVPHIEQIFIKDQRTTRKMFISLVDISTTKKFQKKAIRKEVDANRIERHKLLETYDKSKLDEVNIEFDESVEINDEYNNSDEDFTITSKPSTSSSNIKNSQMRLKLPALALACDRTGISDGSAAKIASAVLQDIGIISVDNKNSVVDRMKVRRAREKKRLDLQKLENELILGLYFDGRKDKTIINHQEGTKYYRKIITEEHISLIQEPGSKYIGHTTPTSGSALEIKNSIIHFLETNNLSTSQIIAIGCDGTVTNTGFKTGVIRQIEEYLKKPLQWLVCLLHANELPLRHLFNHLDGKTSGPIGFSGSLGKQLEICHKLPVVKFVRIEGNLPFLKNEVDLSSDQKYLFEICQSISSGKCSIDLSRRNPGKLAHSRWLTTANRILRLYISTSSPTENLKILTEFILKVYGPMWFHIKINPFCISGSKHLWRTIKFSRYLPNNLLKIIDPVIQRNAYFGSPENILICMLLDNRYAIRKKALSKIINARQNKNDQSIRSFEIPPLNFNATDYVELIDWGKTQVTEPPLTSNIDQDTLRQIVLSHKKNTLEIFYLPCHTQAVERSVKLVTEASAAVCGQARRDGVIRARIESRRIMPHFNSKKYFQFN
ncbi:uncharacterized protein LOC126897791 [Daktulosphaira vitifoliae]|uniref:uncharacterized protein LOC126897791 n=1 Tax=Daktulosphaira vitifoliae TaxID=58002 RepID=UPI0021AAAB0F|nr:uncharacterized protein LOC126897791 [Daktulosphaira vitifoliae]